MSDRLKSAGTLNRLLENNFFVAKCYRKSIPALPEESLVGFFKKKASRRFQFAIELSEEIGFLKGAYSSYGPFSPFQRRPQIRPTDSLDSILQKAIRNDRLMYKEYKKALSEINEGPTREILLRHISYIEESLEDLKALLALSGVKEEKTKTKTEKI